MARSKRTHSGEQKAMAAPIIVSPFMPMFENFRNELDEHHDRRERIIKASRDITALSKKIIFSLQRVRQLQAPIPVPVQKENVPRQDTIRHLFDSVVSDLQGVNAWRYQRQISPGVQELIEAVSFQHYLETQRLITYEQAQGKLPQGLMLTEDDYVLGLFDLVGELMRFAITGMATSGQILGSREAPNAVIGTDTVTSEDAEEPDMICDLRNLRAHFEALDTNCSMLNREVEKKMDVMKTSVEKVENAAYGMIVRGRERPKGWLPEERAAGETVETY